MVILPKNVVKTDCPYKFSKLNRMKKVDLLKECEKYEDCFIDGDCKRDEMIDYLLNRDYEEFYQNEFSNNRFRHREKDFTVYGHCQGDAIEVNLVGKCETWFTKDYFENLYFDTPNYVRFAVADSEENELVELFLSEFKNEYEFFDKDETLRIFGTALESYDFKAEAMEWLENNLPEHLNYCE